MKKGDITKINITTQGAIKVNTSFVTEISKNIVAITIDLHSKYAEILGEGSGENGEVEIIVDGNEKTLGLHKTKTGPTVIELSDFIGWDLHCMELSKYTLRCCLIKKI